MKKYFTIILVMFNCCLIGQQDLQSFYDNYIQGSEVDYQSLSNKNDGLSVLVGSTIKAFNQTQKGSEAWVASGINVYNLLVIQKVINAFPVQSVEQINGFFNDNIDAELKISLNQLEKELIESTKDPRIHFALICGGSSCPSFPKTVFNADNLNTLLESQTRASLKEQKIIEYDAVNQTVHLNQIFKWFQSDFASVGVINFINQYSDLNLPDDVEISYLIYDWTLNNSIIKRYIATNLYNAGEFEIHSFNNYYTQREKGSKDSDNYGRYNFLNHFLNFTIGYTSRVNFGLGFKFRSVNQDRSTTDRLFSALNYENEDFLFNENNQSLSYARTGLTNIYPSIRYTPFEDKPSLSVSHILYIPIGSALEGNDDTGFLDWEGFSLQNSVWYDKDLAYNKSIFFDGTLLFENMGAHVWGKESGFAQIGLSATVIYSRHFEGSWTLYGLGNLTPRIGVNNNGQSKNVTFLPYSQIGVGLKKYVTKNIELESLYTTFYDGTPDRFAQTFNLGLRYIGL